MQFGLCKRQVTDHLNINFKNFKNFTYFLTLQIEGHVKHRFVQNLSKVSLCASITSSPDLEAVCDVAIKLLIKLFALESHFLTVALCNKKLAISSNRGTLAYSKCMITCPPT